MLLDGNYYLQHTVERYFQIQLIGVGDHTDTRQNFPVTHSTFKRQCASSHLKAQVDFCGYN